MISVKKVTTFFQRLMILVSTMINPLNRTHSCSFNRYTVLYLEAGIGRRKRDRGGNSIYDQLMGPGMRISVLGFLRHQSLSRRATYELEEKINFLTVDAHFRSTFTEIVLRAC
jgi:hypothetical protein